MTSMWLQIQSQTVLFLYLGVGVLCRKLGYVDDWVENKLSSVITNIILPCMIFDTMLATLGDVVLSEVLQVGAICVSVVLFSYVLGRVLYRKTAEGEKPVYVYSVISCSSVFIGIPAISLIYGDQGVFYALIYITIARLFAWTLGLDLFIRGNRRNTVRRILTNPNNIAVVVAVVVHYVGIHIPETLGNAIEEIGDASTLACMVLVGSLVAGGFHWQRLKSLRAYGYSFIRLILIPMLTFWGLQLFGIQPVIMGSMVLLVAAPAPIIVCVLATQYGADKELAVLLVFVSTLLSFVTQPLITLVCGL